MNNPTMEAVERSVENLAMHKRVDDQSSNFPSAFHSNPRQRDGLEHENSDRDALTYRHANGAWLVTNLGPPTHEVGRSMSGIRHETYRDVQQVVGVETMV